jgi:hypothetical protein
MSASVGGISSIENDEPRVLHPTVGILEGAPKLTLERSSGSISSEIESSRRWQQFPSPQMVIEEQSEPDDGPGPQALVVRQNESNGSYDVGSELEQDFPLDQRLAN